MGVEGVVEAEPAKEGDDERELNEPEDEEAERRDISRSETVHTGLADTNVGKRGYFIVKSILCTCKIGEM